MGLVNAELCQLKLTFFILTKDGHLLLLALHLGFKLLDQGAFILPKLNLPLLVEPVLLFSDKLLLFALVITENLLRLLIKFFLILLNLLTEHVASILRFHLEFVLHLGQLLLVPALFLSFQVQDLPVHLLLNFALLLFKFPLHVSLELIKLSIVLSLNFAFLSLKFFDVATFRVK